ncbi:hypothetical protein ACTWLI_02595 [Arthrobacter sp. Hor0625]
MSAGIPDAGTESTAGTPDAGPEPSAAAAPRRLEVRVPMRWGDMDA